VRSHRYAQVVVAVPGYRPAVVGVSWWRQWLRCAVAVGLLLLGSTIWYVPRPRRPAGELPMWKLVVWFLLFFMLASLLGFIWHHR